MFEIFFSVESWLSLLSLTAMEIVLGIDNIVFISILASKVPAHQKDQARSIGLMGAFVTRLCLLAGIAWIVTLTRPLFSIFELDFSGKNLILLFGGLFLIYKATKEIHAKVEGSHDEYTNIAGTATLRSVVLQIMIIDIVFSLDSVITAVGMAQSLTIMVAANVIALGIMLWSSKSISNFVDEHPTIKILALSFLLMIGIMLVAEGLSFHIPKGYIYFAMAFSLFTEFLNIRATKRLKPLT